MTVLLGAGRATVPGVDRPLLDLRRPDAVFSAPAPLDPQVPQDAVLVVVVVDAAALGRVIADRCDRPLRVAALAGCSPYQRLTVERAAAALCSRRGYRAAVPDGAAVALAVVPSDDPTSADDLVAACRHTYPQSLLADGPLP